MSKSYRVLVDRGDESPYPLKHKLFTEGYLHCPVQYSISKSSSRYLLALK